MRPRPTLGPDPGQAPDVTTLYLEVPTDHAYLRVLRVTAAAAASHVIDDLDRLDDLRLAVDELAVAVIDASPTSARLQVTIAIDDHGVTIRGQAESDRAIPTLSDVGTMLVASVSEDHAVDRDGEHLYFHVRIRAD